MAEAFKTWNELNDAITSVSDLDRLNEFLNAELARAAPRQQFLLRIHSRMNKVRAQHERLALLSKAVKR